MDFLHRVAAILFLFVSAHVYGQIFEGAIGIHRDSLRYLSQNPEFSNAYHYLECSGMTNPAFKYAYELPTFKDKSENSELKYFSKHNSESLFFSNTLPSERWYKAEPSSAESYKGNCEPRVSWNSVRNYDWSQAFNENNHFVIFPETTNAWPNIFTQPKFPIQGSIDLWGTTRSKPPFPTVFETHLIRIVTETECEKPCPTTGSCANFKARECPCPIVGACQ